MTSAAGKERGAGPIGLGVLGGVVMGRLFGEGLYFFLATSIVRAARHTGEKENIEGEKK